MIRERGGEKREFAGAAGIEAEEEVADQLLRMLMMAEGKADFGTAHTVLRWCELR